MTIRTAPAHAGKEYEDKLTQLAQEAYASYERTIQPKWPWNLVYVLPKGGQRSGLWIPEVENKTMYEGIVLDTWKPFDRELMYAHESHCEHCLTTTMVHVEPTLKRGDHVIFPHWSGIPVTFLPEERYRMVREANGTDPKTDIPGILTYDEEKVDDVLYKILYPKLFVQESQSRDKVVEDLIRHLRTEFDIVKINRKTLTTSGK